MFKLDDNGKQIISPGHPELVAPDITKKQDMPGIHPKIAKLKQFLILNHNNVMWWTDFFTSPPKCFEMVSVTAI